METVEILVNGGAVGIAIALIIANWQKDKMYNTSVNNHLSHMEVATKDETKAKLELNGTLQSIKQLLKDKL